jgi:hypothetical protein
MEAGCTDDQQMSTILSVDAGSRIALRARPLGEEQFLADNGPQSAVFEACKEFGMYVRPFCRRNVPERERANRSAASHRQERELGVTIIRGT